MNHSPGHPQAQIAGINIAPCLNPGRCLFDPSAALCHSCLQVIVMLSHCEIPGQPQHIPSVATFEAPMMLPTAFDELQPPGSIGDVLDDPHFLFTMPVQINPSLFQEHQLSLEQHLTQYPSFLPSTGAQHAAALDLSPCTQEPQSPTQQTAMSLSPASPQLQSSSLMLDTMDNSPQHLLGVDAPDGVHSLTYRSEQPMQLVENHFLWNQSTLQEQQNVSLRSPSEPSSSLLHGGSPKASRKPLSEAEKLHIINCRGEDGEGREGGESHVKSYRQVREECGRSKSTAWRIVRKWRQDQMLLKGTATTDRASSHGLLGGEPGASRGPKSTRSIDGK
ncbi:MAG: hypothetical protein J3Q66DRAFT_416091 [Benniella sp.]|nr:MAG: hypothetical protein J3Q66DRAFT_416091 [Benniella sp.]